MGALRPAPLDCKLEPPLRSGLQVEERQVARPVVDDLTIRKYGRKEQQVLGRKAMLNQRFQCVLVADPDDTTFPVLGSKHTIYDDVRFRGDRIVRAEFGSRTALALSHSLPEPRFS